MEQLFTWQKTCSKTVAVCDFEKIEKLQFFTFIESERPYDDVFSHKSCCEYYTSAITIYHYCNLGLAIAIVNIVQNILETTKKRILCS